MHPVLRQTGYRGHHLECEIPFATDTLADKPLAGDPQELFHAAQQAKRILFLADNAGEIVFDRLNPSPITPNR